MNVLVFLEKEISQGLAAVGAPAGSPALIRTSSQDRFGDYQANGVMPAAKKMGMAPRQLAERLVAHLNLHRVVEKMEVAGPGFINIFLKKEWIESTLTEYAHDLRCGIAPVPSAQTVVVDLSSPNIAKEMHVAHLRSTVIGDAVARTLEFLGHTVIRANHIGDWGTQFGMLIAHLEDIEKAGSTAAQAAVCGTALGDLEDFYRQAKKKYDDDSAFAERARGYVVKLQGGDSWCREQWQRLVDITMTQNLKLYQRLNVRIEASDTMGESMYNDMLPVVVKDLQARGLAVRNEGAVVVYLDDFRNKDGDPMGVIIEKRDGGFLYTTTDIASAKYRAQALKADRILYYIDARQSQHLQQAWAIARKAGYVADRVSIEHHSFGMMLGKDNRPFKTRAGGVVKLSALLDEAVVRAGQLIEERGATFEPDQKADVIQAIAIGAVKYSDLSKNRTSDYVFEWDNMLSFEGNTAPYMMYAYTRIQSIFGKAGVQSDSLTGRIALDSAAERSLAVTLLQFEQTLNEVAQKGMPHLLCSYLYTLAGCFMRFYESCPVNRDDLEAPVRQSRFLLCSLVARTLALGLQCLGIKTVEKM